MQLLPLTLFGIIPEEKIVYEKDQLEVKVDIQPIGGYRGKAGTLTIDHKERKVFTDWEEKDLETLAELTRLILFIFEREQIFNTLIFCEQNQNEFSKISFIVYPRCDLMEKVEGLTDVIFGSLFLKEEEVKEISDFYKPTFLNREKEEIPSSDGEERGRESDPFCRQEVIDKQKISDLSFHEESYYLLHDQTPKGRFQKDPHFLIIPKGDAGHCDGSFVSLEKRIGMFKAAQKAMKILLSEGYFHCFFLERIGKDLPSVQHKHCNVIGMKEFPLNLSEKYLTIGRQIFASPLSETDLKKRIKHYQAYDWSLQ